MKTVGIIQARLNSRRLPRKMLADICGEALLWHVCERAMRSQKVDEWVVAVPLSDAELLPVVPGTMPVLFCQAPEHDLVQRYLEAAWHAEADFIVRLPADNPCVSPMAIDRLVDFYRAYPVVYASNTKSMWRGQLVDGLGAEMFSWSTLLWLEDRLDAMDTRREHPHQYFHDMRAITYVDQEVMGQPRLPDVLLDVNTADDLEFIRGIYESCYSQNPQFEMEEIWQYLLREGGFYADRARLRQEEEG